MYLLISPADCGAFQANIFDGKSDGKKILRIFLLPTFTVRKLPRGVKVYKKRPARSWGSPSLRNP
jgi:hypothetical protein